MHAKPIYVTEIVMMLSNTDSSVFVFIKNIIISSNGFPKIFTDKI